jgi:CheY-like chemotaxis protein
MTTRVLVVEDNRADARLLQELLAEVPGRPFVLTFAETLADGIVHAESSDVILLDLSLPDAHGR